MPEPIPKGALGSESVNMSDPTMERQGLAVLAARIMSMWPNIEWAVHMLVNTIAPGNTDLLAKAFAEIRHHHGQTKTLLGIAATASRSEEDLTLLKKILKKVEKAAKPRNDLAHMQWGTHSVYPDAIILSPISGGLALHRVMSNNMTMAVSSNNEGTEFDARAEGPTPYAATSQAQEEFHNGLRVWRKADFTKAREQMRQVLVQLIMLNTLFSTGTDSAEAASIRKALSEWKNPQG
jgi:hypothetical protein